MSGQDRTLEFISRQLHEITERVNRLERLDYSAPKAPVVDRLRGVSEPYYDLCQEAAELIEALEQAVKLRDAQLDRYRTQLVELSKGPHPGH